MSWFTKQSISLKRKYCCVFKAIIRRPQALTNFGRLDPIWSVKTKGLFLLETTAKELFQGDGLHLEVMDFDAVGKNERLGQTSIDARSMFQCNGQRIKLPLQGKGAQGILSIRVRRATLYDKNFMKEYQMTDMTKAYSETDDTMKAMLSKKGGISAIQSALSRNVKVEKHAIGPPVKKVSKEEIIRRQLCHRRESNLRHS